MRGVRLSEPRFAWRETGRWRKTEIDTPEGKATKERVGHPMGVSAFMRLAADQGRSFDFATSWIFVAVVSTRALWSARGGSGDGLGASIAGDAVKRVRWGDGRLGVPNAGPSSTIWLS